MTTEIISRYKLISSNLTPENVNCRYYYTTSSSSTTLIHVIGDFHVDSHYNVVFVNEPYATARQSLDSIRTFFFRFSIPPPRIFRPFHETLLSHKTILVPE